MCQYEKHGIREDLLDVIFDKKLKLILKAKTASEVKRASEAPKPDFLSRHLARGSLLCSEEELALWAIVSPNNMLIPPARERYMDLYSRVRDHEVWHHKHGALPDVKLEEVQ